MWQTVAVRTVDEAAERAQLAAQEAVLEEERVSGVRASIIADNVETGDVMKSYDPYNRGIYKGIKVSRESTETEVLLVEFLFPEIDFLFRFYKCQLI
jgi:hypothetical protein